MWTATFTVLGHVCSESFADAGETAMQIAAIGILLVLVALLLRGASRSRRSAVDLADHARGVAQRDGARGDVACDDRARADDGAVADRHAPADRDAAADPHGVADRHRPGVAAAGDALGGSIAWFAV